MNCFNCGELVPEGQNFCANCGAPLNADPEVASIRAEEPAKASSGSKVWLWILLGCGGLLVVGCCLSLVLLFSVSGVVSETASEVLGEMQSSRPELFDEKVTQVAPLLPEPSAVPTSNPLPEQTAEHTCGILGLTTQPWLQVETNCEQVPAQTETDFLSVPAHTRLNLAGYPVAPAFHEAQVNVFPVEAYRALDDNASERIDQLQDLLERRPARVEGPLPFLPVWNAAQTMAVKFAYVEFSNGSGVRYLAQYGQSAWPINNEDLFYTFQGLTADGEYYLSVVLPVTHPDLPPDGDSYIGEEYDAFIASYAQYLEEVVDQLEDSASKSYHPRLTELDAVIETLSVR